MQMKSFVWALGMVAITSALLGCGQKADTAAEKAATDAKDKVVADAKAAEALVKEKREQRRRRGRFVRQSSMHVLRQRSPRQFTSN